MRYALYKDGQRASEKAYSTRDAAAVEAFERGAVVSIGHVKQLADGWQILKLAEGDR